MQLPSFVRSSCHGIGQAAVTRDVHATPMLTFAIELSWMSRTVVVIKLRRTSALIATAAGSLRGKFLSLKEVRAGFSEHKSI